MIIAKMRMLLQYTILGAKMLAFFIFIKQEKLKLTKKSKHNILKWRCYEAIIFINRKQGNRQAGI